MFDFIKRARLTRRGMSCGKTRRKHLQSETWETLLTHPLISLGIFVTSCLGSIILLQALSTALDIPFRGVDAIYVAAIFLIAGLSWHLGISPTLRTNSNSLLAFFVIMLHLTGVGVALSYGRSRGWDTSFSLLLAPHALAPVLLAMLVGRRIGFYAATYATLLGATLVDGPYILPFIATSMGIGFTGIFVTQKIRRRSRLLTAGVYIGITASIFMVAFGQAGVALQGESAFFRLATPMLVGLGTTMLAGAILPALENLFRVTTDVSWLELADLNHPLMKRLSIEAPGTYHHCLVVANLADAAAEAIGANATMCRVCSYFHDIGKLTKPEYFIENMDPEDNPHDDLTARMSALVLIAHVKDGIDLAIKNHLNRRIIDVIEQHHGNSLVYYFYRRALDQKNEIIRLVEQDKAREDDVPDVTEDGFRYPGPRPQCRETAIISLADAVESASRTLAKPTPNRVEQLVEDIVRNRLLDHQLDECDLTLAELTEVKASFVKTLLSMMHNRVRYPKETVEETKKVTSQMERTERPQPTGKPDKDKQAEATKPADAA
jgi:putative nucleotidyltransferase with HDIG domain